MLTMIILTIILIAFVISTIITIVIKGDELASAILILCSLIYFVIYVSIIVIILSIQIPAKKDYEKALMQKEMLEYRLENDNIGIGNELLYNDIVKFNQELKDTKYYANNLWTNWFVNDYIAKIDYIEIKKREN